MPISSARVKAVWPWLMEYRHAWLAILVVALALVICFYEDPSERSVRLTGLVLQILGIATVVWGISVTRALFGHVSVASVILNWAQRCPLLKQTHSLSGSVSVSVASSLKASGYQTNNPPANATVDQRLESLERNVQLIHDRISGAQNEFDSDIKKASEALGIEAAVRETADRRLNETLQETSLGGVHISAIGALWLFVGVTLSTAAPEIAGWIQ